MGAGASIDKDSLPDRMTLSEVEDKVGFQARLLGKVKERFEAVASTGDKKISKEHFLIGIANGMGGAPGKDRPPEELQRLQEEEARQTVEDEAHAKAIAAKVKADKAAAEAESAAKRKTGSKYDFSQFKVKAYDPEEIKRRRAEQLKREKKRLEILAMDPNKAENEKQRDKILRVQAREQEMLSDMQSRKGLTHLKDTRSRMTTEDKLATHANTKIKAVSYDEQTAKDAKDTTVVETCSCLQGEPCVIKDNCLDWTNRFAVAKAYGLGFGKSKTGIHFSQGTDLQDQSSETLTVNGKVLGR